jgi:uncharacterized protein YndB with AHSA1/START domain
LEFTAKRIAQLEWQAVIYRKRKSMLKGILIVLAVIIVVFVVIVATRPDDFRVTRTATIAAPAAVVFEQVNDLHKWEAWSPWAKLDLSAKTSYEGPPSGVGATFHWDGNMDVGTGSMTITESRPGELVRFRLEFVKPFKGTNTAEFDFKTEGNQTTVTWSTFGKANFMTKAVGLFMDCDKIMGGQFEQGFANLKSVLEAAEKK